MMKKTLLFIFIILLVLSIGNVSATNDTDTSTSDITNHDNVISENTENNNTILLSNGNAQKSMVELENTIKNNKNTTILLNNDYQWTQQDTDLEKGIILDKSIGIDGQGHTIDAKSKMRIFQVTNNAMVTFKNINFLNGKFDSMWALVWGGAVWNKGAKKVTLINCTFTGNNAEYGGAIYKCIAINCTFTNNAASRGGAIFAKKDIIVKNTTFINNKAETLLNQCCGGAIFANTITWINNPSYFIGNYVDDNQGGAISTNKFETDVKYAVFINNNVKSNDDGGAIYINEENHITFAKCYFENNRCGDEGGAIYLDSRYSHLTLKDNSFINNTAGGEGQTVFNKGYYDEISNIIGEIKILPQIMIN